MVFDLEAPHLLHMILRKIKYEQFHILKVKLNIFIQDPIDEIDKGMRMWTNTRGTSTEINEEKIF